LWHSPHQRQSVREFLPQCKKLKILLYSPEHHIQGTFTIAWTDVQRIPEQLAQIFYTILKTIIAFLVMNTPDNVMKILKVTMPILPESTHQRRSAWVVILACQEWLVGAQQHQQQRQRTLA